VEDQNATTLDLQNVVSQSESQQKRLMREIQVLEQKVCKCFGFICFDLVFFVVMPYEHFKLVHLKTYHLHLFYRWNY
jgi:hypothetical protein